VTTHIGNQGKVKVGSSFVAEVKEFSLSVEATVADDTVLGDTWETHLVGTKKWSGSITCQWDETDANGQETLSVGASVTLGLYPEGSDSGATYLSGTATVTQVAYNVSLNGVVTRAISIQGNGALAESTV
jgi:hypothetical protein